MFYMPSKERFQLCVVSVVLDDRLPSILPLYPYSLVIKGLAANFGVSAEKH